MHLNSGKVPKLRAAIIGVHSIKWVCRKRKYENKLVGLGMVENFEKEKKRKIVKNEKERIKDHMLPEYEIKNKNGEIRVE